MTSARIDAANVFKAKMRSAWRTRKGSSARMAISLGVGLHGLQAAYPRSYALESREGDRKFLGAGKSKLARTRQGPRAARVPDGLLTSRRRLRAPPLAATALASVRYVDIRIEAGA